MLSSALSSLRRGWSTLAGESAEVRAAFDAEIGAQNLRSFPWIFSVLAVLHVGAAIAFSKVPTPTAAHVAWSFWLVRVHLVMTAVAIAIVVTAARARSPLTGARLGDVATAAYVVAGGLISGNVQRLQPNQNMFLLGLLCATLMMNGRPRVFFASVGAGTGALVACVQRFGADPTSRVSHTITASSVGLLSLVAFAVVRVARLREIAARQREIAARQQVEQLNLGLEGRVAAQVELITQRAKEIEKLNEQLNQQVKERSRELSMALARLAMDHQPLPPGTILGDRVEIEARIGEGGMGAVYRARDLVTGSAVAVKVVQAGSINELDGLYRFLREAQALASLAHPAIVRSFHIDVADDGRLFQVMELVSGETLQAWLDREGPLPIPAAARLGAVLADALANAHEAGIVHRDVKPANVMLTTTSPGIKLLDFGVSRLRDARAAHGRTEGSVIGTPEFMSPEQIHDPEHVGDRSDVYALGLVLYRAMSGRPPYDTASARSWLVAHVAQPPQEITTAIPGIDPEVASTVMVCLDKAPEGRPSAAEVARSLAACADRLGCASLESLWKTAPPAPPESPGPEPQRTLIVRAEITGRRTLKVVR